MIASQILLLADGVSIFRTKRLNGDDEVIAAETPDRSIEQVLGEKYQTDSPNDAVNPSGSHKFCGADAEFDEGTIKFSIYSKFARDDKSQVEARKINDGLPAVYRTL